MKRTATLTMICSFALLICAWGGTSPLQHGENPAPHGAAVKPPALQQDPVPSSSGGRGITVALLADEDLRLADVSKKVVLTGKVDTADKYNIYTGALPTLSQLQAFDAVLVWGGSYLWSSQVSIDLGDLLADYVDSGGGVVVATFALGSNGGYWIPQGRFASDYYQCIIPALNQLDGQATLGTVHQPFHPIMQGVNSFDGGSSSYRVDTTIDPFANLIAEWSDREPLIATKDLGIARRADLNFYPPSSDVRSDFWQTSTDGDMIMANALDWVANAPDPFTLAVSPDPLQGGSSASFDITGGDPNTATYLVHSLAGLGSTYVPQLNVTLDLANPSLTTSPADTDQYGAVTWNLNVPNVSGINVWFQVLQYENATNVVATSIQ